MTIEAMKLALEALSALRPTALTSFYTIGDRDRAIEALHAAIEQAEKKRCPLCDYQHGHQIGCKNNPVDIALAKQAERNQFNPDWDAMAVMVEEQQRMAKRIEELEQAEKHEPVAVVDTQGRLVWLEGNQFFPEKPIALYDVVVYTAPPQREWKGLTTAETKVLWNLTKKPREYAQMIEQKLREKNA